MGKLSMGLLAAGAGAFYLFTRGKTVTAADGTKVKISSKHKPIAVKAGEDDQVANYRIIAARRPNMTYVPVTAGTPPGILTFPATTGLFTRNFVSENGVLMAEIKV